MTSAGEKTVTDVVALHLITLAAVMLLWFTPLAYPLRLLATLIHEVGHLFAATLTGGTLREIKVHMDAGGHVWREGGVDWLVFPAGYIATSFFGALLLLGTSTAKGQRYALAGAVLLLAGFLGVSAADPVVLVALGGLLAWVLIVLIRDWEIVRAGTVRVLALTICMHAVFDLLALLIGYRDRRSYSVWHFPIPRPRPEGFYTDATLMAWRYGGSEGMWALVWLVFSAALLALALWHSARTETREPASSGVSIAPALRVYTKGEGEYEIR